MHWWLAVRLLINVYSQFNTETVVVHVIYVQTMCEELSCWWSLILYMHHVTLGWCYTHQARGLCWLYWSLSCIVYSWMCVVVVLFRSNMCVWYTTELQVMTLLVTLNVSMTIEQLRPGDMIHDKAQQSMLINVHKAGWKLMCTCALIIWCHVEQTPSFQNVVDLLIHDKWHGQECPMRFP